MNKYTTLQNILDVIRDEAPQEFKRYHPIESAVEEINRARARAYIHLFLKVKFGILDFKKREEFITDDPQDGGIDGYFFDYDTKRIYFIQAKFRTTEKNFNEKEILYSELLLMDTDRISHGEKKDENGKPYNSKILKMQSEINKIPDIGRWNQEIIILANISGNISQSKIKKISGGFPTTVYNYSKVYEDLVFPVIQGTFYNSTELRIFLNLSNTSSQSSKVNYQVKTQKGNCDITLVFVPTLEIAITMYKYRNSILKYNPRSYLELSNNTVNRDIANSVINMNTNEFALYNNGITLLSYGTDFNEKIGQKDRGQLIVCQPQIINGGQTAYTLSRIYEEYVLTGKNKKIFDEKEVLLKVITFDPRDDFSDIDHIELIEDISKATNQQSQVNEADRRANEGIQIQLQKFLFDKFGVFYERKRGEFADGIRSGYIYRKQIVDRELFVRICKCCNLEPSDAKRMSLTQLFDIQNFKNTLVDPNRFIEYYFAYQCFLTLNEIKGIHARDKINKYGIQLYGNGLSQGIYSVVTVCSRQYEGEHSFTKINDIAHNVLTQWMDFENYAIQQTDNNVYFRLYKDSKTGIQREELNFINYYKGKTVARDLQAFFRII